MDTPSIDYGQSLDFIVHQVAAAANVPASRMWRIWRCMPERGAWVITLPMKVR